MSCAVILRYYIEGVLCILDRLRPRLLERRRALWELVTIDGLALRPRVLELGPVVLFDSVTALGALGARPKLSLLALIHASRASKTSCSSSW